MRLKNKLLYLLTIFQILFGSVFAQEEGPSLKGDYLVCPNGNAISRKLWGFSYMNVSNADFSKPGFEVSNWDYDFLSSYDTLPFSWIRSEVLIGKSIRSYSNEEIKVIKMRFLKGANIKSSYKSNKINYSKLYGRPIGEEWTFKFQNSQGKHLTINWRKGFGIEIIDNSKNILKGNTWNNSGLGKFICKENQVILKVVELVSFEDVNNQYGENISLPLFLWIREVGIPAMPLRQKKYDF